MSRTGMAACFGLIVLTSLTTSRAPAGEWAATPSDPVLNPVAINFDGTNEDGSTTVVVEPGQVVTISATADDTDSLTDGSSTTEEADGTQIVWSTSDGTLGSTRTDSGATTTWTAPTLGSSEDSRNVTLTATPDDDSTSNPGGPLNGHTGNRNDAPGVAFALAVQVKKPCKVTGASADKTKVSSGTKITFTATGDSLDDVDWYYRAAPNNWTLYDSGASIEVTNSGWGDYVFEARCNGTKKSVAVEWIGVDRIIVNGSNPEILGTTTTVGTKVTLKAIPTPNSTTFPTNEPDWSFQSKPAGSSLADPADGSATADVTPDVAGTYVVKASCGTSSQTFTLIAGGNRLEVTALLIMRDPEVCKQDDFAPELGGTGYNMGLAKIVAKRKVTIGFDTTGTMAAPTDIEIKVEHISGTAGAFQQVGSTFKKISDIAAKWRSGDTQYTGAAASGTVVLDSTVGPTTSPVYVPADKPFGEPGTEPWKVFAFKRINADGRWAKASFSITVNGGTASLSVTASQQARAAIVDRTP